MALQARANPHQSPGFPGNAGNEEEMTTTETTGKIDMLIRTSKLLARMNKSRPGARASGTLYYQMLAEYYTRVRDAHKNGKMLAAHTVFFPPKYCMRWILLPMHTETTTWLTALFLKEQAELLAKSAELGLAPEICSPHRGVAGIFGLHAIPAPMSFFGQISSAIIPPNRESC